MSSHQLEHEKLKLIHWITELRDNAVIEKLQKIMSAEQSESLSKNERAAIDEALNSIDKNGTLSHNQVMEETKNRYSNLFKK
ncbi:hypothetical protein [Flavobacterium haoranii]|uniref:Addiction module component n=1 Tax=Flavobacterium haoranii TaxID=683124 RepID=A0A1M6DW70_9FLAO|nr:hypothetical protein [Flavobacterium haoranii]SHI77471.1 hypothetical protein SAMN05444337_0759 [Flavobacterium haoranii]